MKVTKLTIANFRGIKSAEILLNGNSVFVGDNNSGKSTIFEALDLVMGPDRLPVTLLLMNMIFMLVNTSKMAHHRKLL